MPRGGKLRPPLLAELLLLHFLGGRVACISQTAPLPSFGVCMVGGQGVSLQGCLGLACMARLTTECSHLRHCI